MDRARASIDGIRSSCMVQHFQNPLKEKWGAGKRVVGQMSTWRGILIDR